MHHEYSSSGKEPFEISYDSNENMQPNSIDQMLLVLSVYILQTCIIFYHLFKPTFRRSVPPIYYFNE